MADAISPHHHQHVGHWTDLPSSAHGRQHYCIAWPVRPLPDKYALATDERTDKQMNIAIA